jgi:hypothetical protein
MDQGFDPCFVQGMVHVKNTVMTTQGFYLWGAIHQGVLEAIFAAESIVSLVSVGRCLYKNDADTRKRSLIT